MKYIVRGRDVAADDNDVYSTWEGRQRQMTMTYIVRGKESGADNNDVYSMWEGVRGRQQ